MKTVSAVIMWQVAGQLSAPVGGAGTHHSQYRANPQADTFIGVEISTPLTNTLVSPVTQVAREMSLHQFSPLWPKLQLKPKLLNTIEYNSSGRPGEAETEITDNRYNIYVHNIYNWQFKQQTDGIWVIG